MNNLPVLITSSVHAMDTSVKLIDSNLRIKHTVESLYEWKRINPKGKFVICDGSNFDFSEIIKKKFPDLEIECISFLNDYNMVQKYGKGYGEGEIIQYAIKKSILINKSNTFVKCTGKLWVQNYFDCIYQWNGKFLASAYFSNVFSVKQLKIGYLDTRFYIANKNYFQKNFGRAHLDLSEKKDLSIEEKYLEILLKKNEKYFLFNKPPIICGVGGGSGSYYNSSSIRILKNRLKNWIIKKEDNYHDLFIS